MAVLPDLVPHRARVVFCGVTSRTSLRPRVREHFYDGPGNAFWDLLHRSGLADRLAPQDDHRLPGLGLGLTDLVREEPSDPLGWEVEDLAAKVAAWQPEWLAFTSKTAAQAYARAAGERRPQLGVAAWDVAGADVFVLPGPSGANQRRDYDGRPTRLSWWRDLAQLVPPRSDQR